MIKKTKTFRQTVLEKTKHNLLIVPEELVERDYVTDSLLNKSYARNGRKAKFSVVPQAVNLEIEKAFRKLFGFPHVTAVSQGRVAEALMCRLMVRNGHTIPGSALFPTTRIHQQLNGAGVVEVMIEEAWDPQNAHPFKGNLDLEKLRKVIEEYHPRWIPFICVEPCNNAAGGHPVSMKNMRGVSQLAKQYGIPVYLDACRLIDNALMIRAREKGYEKKPLIEIVREFCSYADGCTMSLMKDFPVSIGGFFATRNEELHHQAMDFLMGFGSGLSFGGKCEIHHALSGYKKAFRFVENRARLVKALHSGLKGRYPVVYPEGGHAVYMDMAEIPLKVAEKHHPAKAFLHFLYEEYGIRGAENPSSLEQEKRGLHWLRFAVPILNQSKHTIRQTVRNLVRASGRLDQVRGLQKTGEPPGLTGPMRAYYRPVSS